QTERVAALMALVSGVAPASGSTKTWTPRTPSSESQSTLAQVGVEDSVVVAIAPGCCAAGCALLAPHADKSVTTSARAASARPRQRRAISPAISMRLSLTLPPENDIAASPAHDAPEPTARAAGD